MNKHGIPAKLTVFASLFLLAGTLSAQPDWDTIKANAKPFVALPDEFEAPYKLPIAVGGWEDGLYVTRDGLNLYCIYLPVDAFSFVYAGDGDITNFSAYRRGPTFGMDLTTNPAGASEWLHGDILYTHRNSVDEPFPEWQLSNLARPVFSEGAVQVVMKNDSTADFFVYTSNHDSAPGADDVDILFFRDSSLNPSGVGEFLPPPVRTDQQDTNPHIERLDDSNLVLFYDSGDRFDSGGPVNVDMSFSTSDDDGATWSQPKPLTSLNTAGDDQMPHPFRDDNGQWWLYFMGEDLNTMKSGIYRARQETSGDWDSWTDKELVIGVGNTFAVGEPTLTRYGDIAFVVIYEAADGTPTDKYDNDPWVMPRKSRPTSVSDKRSEIPDGFQLSQNYPNPFNPETTIRYQLQEADQVRLAIYNLLGQQVRTLVNQNQISGSHTVVWDGRNDAGEVVTSGMYFYKLKVGGAFIATRKMVLLR